MSQNAPFTGLTMPVFAAFGWAGEEQAIEFALTQLESFASQLHANLPNELRTLYPFHGLNRQGQVAYLSADEDAESNAHIFFTAKPLKFGVTIALTDKKKLDRAYKNALKDVGNFHRLIQLLGPNWELRIQQMEIMDDAGSELSHFQDLFKDDAANVTTEQLTELIERAAYLNNDAQWKVPIFLTHRMESEQISIMGQGAIKHLSQFLENVLPISRLLANKMVRTGKTKEAKEAPRDEAAKQTSARDLILADRLEQLIYVSELKPICIRKGFIPLTAEHWPFFAQGARSTSRDVLVLFGRNQKEKAQVWRLVSNNQARIVLEQDAHHWISDTFNPQERIEVLAVKDEAGELTLTLKPVA